jgi:hypothetical protein
VSIRESPYTQRRDGDNVILETAQLRRAARRRDRAARTKMRAPQRRRGTKKGIYIEKEIR